MLVFNDFHFNSMKLGSTILITSLVLSGLCQKAQAKNIITQLPQPVIKPLPLPPPNSRPNPQPPTISVPNSTTSNSTIKVTELQVRALVEALRLSAAKKVPSNSNLYSEWRVMSDNIPRWSKQCHTNAITPAEFAANPSLARKILNCVMTGVLQDQYNLSNNSEIIAVQRAAAWWMTGDGQNFSKPDIIPYGQKVLGFYTKLIANPTIIPTTNNIATTKPNNSNTTTSKKPKITNPVITNPVIISNPQPNNQSSPNIVTTKPNTTNPNPTNPNTNKPNNSQANNPVNNNNNQPIFNPSGVKPNPPAPAKILQNIPSFLPHI